MKRRFLQSAWLVVMVAGTVRGATLEVDAGRSRIEVEAKATGHGFTGTLGKYVVKGSGDGGTLAPATLALSWNFQDLKTADADRDAAMIKWLGGGTPQGSFKLVKGWTDAQGVSNAQGTLTIHGVSKTVSFPYTAKKSGDSVTLSGKVAINYETFSLPVVRAMLVMTVDPQLVVNFRIVGKIK